MSEERDRDLSRHYRAASAELPPPALGADTDEVLGGLGGLGGP